MMVKRANDGLLQANDETCSLMTDMLVVQLRKLIQAIQKME